MRLITILIAGRCNHVLDFDAALRADDAPETYVLSQEGVSTQLFEFYNALDVDCKSSNNRFDDDDDVIGRGVQNKDVFPVLLQDDSSQQQVYIEAINLSDKTIQIVLTTSQLSALPKINTKELRLVYNEEGTMLGLCLIHDQAGIRHLNVQFILKDGGDFQQTRDFKLSIAPYDSIRDIVLDFGSEASQMAIFDDGMDINDICRIFPQMKELIGQLETLPERGTSPETNKSSVGEEKKQEGKAYLQQDNHTDYLYRSIFFTNPHATAGLSPVPDFDAEKSKANKANLYTLTTEMEAQNLQDDGYIQMPNVKISGFGGIKEPLIAGKPLSKFSDSFFYRATINRFVLNGLLNADTECVRLYVLMPNVYSHFDVCNRLRMLRKDIKEMIGQTESGNTGKKGGTEAEDTKRENLKQRLNVRAVELIVVSESDASLLGALDILTDVNNKKFLPGCYLLIDAGKGTTDFSIVEYMEEPEVKLVSMYRSGIIGAGNALTYAHLFALLHDYMAQVFQKEYTPIQLCDFVYNRIMKGGDVAKVRKLMEAIDTYKIAVSKDCDQLKFGERFKANENLGNSTYSTEEKEKMNIDSLTLDSFLAFSQACVKEGLREYRPLSEEGKRYIDGMLGQITKEVCIKLKITNAPEFKNIKGVFFAGRAFRDFRLREAMLKALSNITTNEMVYLDTDHLAYDEKNICLFIRGQLLEGIANNRMYSHPYSMISQANNKREDEDESKKEGCVSRLGRYLIDIFGKKSLKDRADKISSALDYVDDENDTEEYDFVASLSQQSGLAYGYDIEIFNKSRDRILIGNRRYSTGDLCGRLKLFYAGEVVYLRSEKGRCVKITPQMSGANMEKSPLTFATLFPYLKADNSGDIYVGFADAPHKEESSKGLEGDEKDVISSDQSISTNDTNDHETDDSELEKLKSASEEFTKH